MRDHIGRITLSRRAALIAGSAAVVAPFAGHAGAAREISWDDLIPPGLAYGEIIGEGVMDEVNDLWFPVFDANAKALNMELDGALIRMPGFIIPLELEAAGVTRFVLVPYVGACLHVPPPPPNQLVHVTTAPPWPGSELWEAVWVTGTLRAQMQSTEVAETGYTLHAEEMEIYVW